jgi:hypothetical protein
LIDLIEYNHLWDGFGFKLIKPEEIESSMEIKVQPNFRQEKVLKNVFHSERNKNYSSISLYNPIKEVREIITHTLPICNPGGNSKSFSFCCETKFE